MALILAILGRWPFSGKRESGAPNVPIDFSTLERSESPNDYLMAPPELCRSAPDEASPVFPVSVSQLKSAWFSVVAEMPRTELLFENGSDHFIFEQRSFLFRFPDHISVRFMALPEGHSTLAVYSRSVYGYSDLGVNRKRVQAWVRLLRERLPEAVRSAEFQWEAFGFEVFNS